MMLPLLLALPLFQAPQDGVASPAPEVMALLDTPAVEAPELFRQAWLHDRSLAPLLAELERREQAAGIDQEPMPSTAKEWRLLRARLLHQRGDLRTALKLVDSLVAATPVKEGEAPSVEAAALLWEQARLLDATGQTAAALAAFTAALPAYLGSPEEGEIRLRMAMLQMDEGEEAKGALSTYASAEGRDAAMRNRAAIVLALLGRPQEAIDLFVISGEGQARFRQEIRVAEWALKAKDAEAAQEHAWQARAAATLKRDRWYALTVLVEAHRMDDSLDRLIDRFAAEAELDEPSRQVWIDLLRERERFDEARALFATHAGEEGFPVEMQRELLEMDREAGRAEEMVASYEKLIVDEPERVTWPEGLARYWLEMGDADQARAAWDTFLATVEPGPQLLAGASALMGLGQDDLAIAAAERCIADGRGRWQAYLFLFDLHRTRGQLEAAEEALERMDAAAPADAPERMQLAESFERIGRLDRAVTILQGIREARGPGEVAEDLEMRLAWLLSETGQEEAAMAQWRSLWRRVDSIPRRRYVEDRMMTVASRLGVLADIVIELEGKLRDGTADDRDAGLLVRLYTKVGDPVSATEVIEEYLKHSGGSAVDALQEKARVYLACTDYRGYERTVHQLIEADPEGEPDYLRQLAMSMLERGRPEQARGVLARLDEMEDRTDGSEFEAGVLALAGMKEEAAAAYRAGIAAKPNRIESYLLLANMMRDAGEKTRAIGMFQYLVETAEKDDLFTIAIDGLLNMEAPASVLRWAQRITLERLASRHDKTYLYELLADLAEESGDREAQIAATEGMLPIAGDRRPSIVRELMDLAAQGDRRVFGQDTRGNKAFLAYGRRLIGLGQLVPPQVYLDLGRAFLQAGDIKDAVRTFGLARDLPDLAQFQRETAALYEENGYLDEALVGYRRALISDAGSVFLLTKVAALLEQTGKDAEAYGLYRKATELLLARRPFASSKSAQEEDEDPFARYFARNVDDFDRYFEAAVQGVMVTASAAEASALLKEQEQLLLAELAKVEAQDEGLNAYPRLRDRSDFLRKAALAFGDEGLVESLDRQLLAHFPADQGLLEQLVRQRVRWGLLPSARALLRLPGVDAEQARALGFLVGEGVEASATDLVPPTEAVALMLPLVVGDRKQDLRELLRRVDYGDKSDAALKAAPTLLAAARMTEDQDLLLFVGRHRLRQMLTKDRSASSYELQPVFDRLANQLDAEHLRSLAQYFVSLVLEDPENRGQALAMLPEMQKHLAEPLMTAEQIKELLEQQGQSMMYSLGAILSLAAPEDQPELAAKVWDQVAPTMRAYFVINLVETFDGEMSPEFSALILDWFESSLEDQLDNFYYQIPQFFEDRMFERRGELVHGMVERLLKHYPEDLAARAAGAVLLQLDGKPEEALQEALDVWSQSAIQERSENFAWVVENLIQTRFIDDNPEPFLDRFEELEADRAPDLARARRHLSKVQQLGQPARTERAARMALERLPGELPLLSSLAQALRAQGKLMEAAHVYDAAVESKPDDEMLARAQFYALKGVQPLAAQAALEHWQALVAEKAEAAEENPPAPEEEGPLAAHVINLKLLVDAGDEAGATLMLRRLWREWPQENGNFYGGTVYFFSNGDDSQVELPWPPDPKEATEAEKAESEAWRAAQLRGGLATYREPKDIKPQPQPSAWTVLADQPWAREEMARRVRADGPTGVGRHPSLLAGLAAARVLEAGNAQAAVAALLEQAKAGAADATDYRILLTLLEEHPEVISPAAREVLGELERNVEPGDGNQLLRLARVMAATGARDRAISLYRWCTTMASASAYYAISFDEDSSSQIPVQRLVKEVKEVLVDDPELVPLIEMALRQAAPSQNPWERESYERMVLDTWSGLLEPAAAVEKCRDILDEVTSREQPLRRQVAQQASRLFLKAGMIDRAIEAFEVGYASFKEGEFKRERYSWGGTQRAQYLSDSLMAEYLPEDPSRLPQAAEWYRAFIPAFRGWLDQDRLGTGALRFASLMALRAEEAGLHEEAISLVQALAANHASHAESRDTLFLLDVARAVGEDALADRLELELLGHGQLPQVRVPEALEHVAVREGSVQAVAKAKEVLSFLQTATAYRAATAIAEAAAAEMPEAADLAASWSAAAEEAASAEAAIKAWEDAEAEKRKQEQDSHSGRRLIRMR